jgi:hypothetical protein
VGRDAGPVRVPLVDLCAEEHRMLEMQAFNEPAGIVDTCLFGTRFDPQLGQVQIKEGPPLTSVAAATQRA